MNITFNSHLPSQTNSTKSVWDILKLWRDFSEHVWFHKLSIRDKMCCPSKWSCHNRIFGIFFTLTFDNSKRRKKLFCKLYDIVLALKENAYRSVVSLKTIVFVILIDILQNDVMQRVADLWSLISHFERIQISFFFSRTRRRDKKICSGYFYVWNGMIKT